MKYTEDNIIGIKFKNGTNIYKIIKHDNKYVKLYDVKYQKISSSGEWDKTDVAYNLNSSRINWIPIIDPINSLPINIII